MKMQLWSLWSSVDDKAQLIPAADEAMANRGTKRKDHEQAGKPTRCRGLSSQDADLFGSLHGTE
jgi:hypothetical protein